LQRRGLEFDVPKQQRPLVEILNSVEMRVASSLDRPYEEIAASLGVDVDRINGLVDYLKFKTRARTRNELALIMAIYDRGERRDPDTRTNKEKLAFKLGLQSLKGCDIEVLLETVTPSQRRYITAYYLTDEVISWRDIGNKFGVRRTAAMIMAREGIKRMRFALEAGNNAKNNSLKKAA
jgi:DNA-directed RNA polymerase sigma subunit (sigma70/sigma32)